MKTFLNEAKFEIIQYTPNAIEVIEKAARVCYDSWDKIESGSAEKLIRSCIKRGHHSILEHANITVKFLDISIGMSRELNRHRLMAISERSTRYVRCDDLHFVLPPGLNDKIEMGEALRNRYEIFNLADVLLVIEQAYGYLLGQGFKPEDARQILPLGTVTEEVVTANVREWRHIFRLRCGKRAHWEIREIMKKVLGEFMKRWPCLFDDLIRPVE